MARDRHDGAPREGDCPPIVIVLSGPSGVGKDAVLARLRERGADFAQPVTMTTRAPREGERDNVDYVFVTPDEFRRQLGAGELLEHAEVYGKHYGVPRSQVRRALESGRDVLMRVDVQGAATLREALPGAVFVFLVPDDLAQLERRLLERPGAVAEEVRRRIETCERELEHQPQFDHVVVNVDGDLDAAVDQLLAIAAEERARPGRVAVAV